MNTIATIHNPSLLKISLLAVGIFFGLLSGGEQAEAVVTAQPSCPFTPQAGRQIITVNDMVGSYDNQFHRALVGCSDNNCHKTFAVPVQTPLTVGKSYDVWLATYDDHPNRSFQNQTAEIAQVRFFSDALATDGAEVARTQNSSDLSESENPAWFVGKVASNLEVADTATTLRGWHGRPTNRESTFNSVDVVCVAIDEKTTADPTDSTNPTDSMLFTCPWTADDGLVITDTRGVRADYGVAEAISYFFARPLDAGSYRISIAAHDAYTNRTLAVNSRQANESVRLRFYDASNANAANYNNFVAQSAPTPDLPDGVEVGYVSGVVNNLLTLAAPVDGIRFVHSGYPLEKRGAHSVSNMCALIEPVYNPRVVITDVNPNPSTGPGDAVTITWTSTDVENCRFTGGGIDIPVNPDGLTVVTPSLTTPYMVTCEPIGGGPDVRDTATVIVPPANSTGPNGPGGGPTGPGDPTPTPDDVCISFTSDRRIVRQGETVNLAWDIKFCPGTPFTDADPFLDSVINACELTSRGVVVNTVDTATGVVESSTLTNERTYLLECGAPFGSFPVTVRVLPKISET